VLRGNTLSSDGVEHEVLLDVSYGRSRQPLSVTVMSNLIALPEKGSERMLVQARQLRRSIDAAVWLFTNNAAQWGLVGEGTRC
jgi:hypothetical protein